MDVALTTTVLTGKYHYGCVFLSWLIAVIASLTSIYLSGCIRNCPENFKKIGVPGIAFAMGGGVWSMHFIGMLSYRLPVTVRYDLAITLISLVLSFAAAGLAAIAIRGLDFKKRRFYCGGATMGLGISAMHYLGMEAMVLPAEIVYHKGLVALSIAVAVAASWAAFRLVAWFDDKSDKPYFLLKLTAAMIMGLAVTGMHYTGMAAASFLPHAETAHISPAIDSEFLSLGIFAVTFIILAIALGTAWTRVRIHALELSNEELEVKVADRTRELEIKNRELDKALNQAIEYASVVQKGFLPEKAPSLPGVSLAARTVPARMVGGDFYDYIPMGENRLGVLLGDVSGKGVNAALYMARLVSDFRYLSRWDSDPQIIMSRMNRLLCGRSENGMFSTAIFSLLDIDQRKLIVSNAGHPGLLVRGKGDVIQEKAKAHGAPLGILHDIKYSQEEIDLAPDDLVFIYTDGTTEPRDSGNNQFGLQRLKGYLNHNGRDPVEIVNRLEKTVMDFTGSPERQDDLTCLAMKLH